MVGFQAPSSLSSARARHKIRSPSVLTQCLLRFHSCVNLVTAIVHCNLPKSKFAQQCTSPYFEGKIYFTFLDHKHVFTQWFANGGLFAFTTSQLYLHKLVSHDETTRTFLKMLFQAKIGQISKIYTLKYKYCAGHTSLVP